METKQTKRRPARRKKATTKAAPPADISPLWKEIGLDEPMLATIAAIKFLEPSDIQRELIPHALKGRDCLGQAKTGTGKTAAFAIPMLQTIPAGEKFQAIVLVPTRELAAQVDEHVRMLGKDNPLRTALCYGGRNIRDQIRVLRAGPEIVVGTPGRILDLMSRKELDLSNIRLAVLDEVDRMLDIGFRDDIRRILRAIKSKHQTIFVSATVDDEIRKLAKTYMNEPLELNVSRDELTVENIDQAYVSVDPHDKFATLVGFLRHEKPKLVIVFTNTKAMARRLGERLAKAGVNCKEIHGDLMQARRERVMRSFRLAHIQVLVATDLASRGLDVMEVSHIINYDIPEDSSSYVHRIGRTARMGQRGFAFTFVTPEQGDFLTDIEKLINKQVRKLDAPWIVREHLPRTEPKARATQDAAAEPSGRLREAIHQSEVLDQFGLKPVKRTLGSRFRPSRRRR